MYLLQCSNEEVMGIYGEDKTIVRRRIKMVPKSVPTRLVEIVMRISKVIPKQNTQQISELKHFGDHVCQNWTGRSKRSSTVDTEVKTGGV